jgi:hypothetical protein
MKLYRLKSNKNTIVEKIDIFHRVVWTSDMETHGIDRSNMIHIWNDKNVIELNKIETREILTKINNFKSNAVEQLGSKIQKKK